MPLLIREVRSRPVIVPMKRPLRTSSGAVTVAPLVLIDLVTDDGITGRSYLFGVAPLTLKPLCSLIDAMGKMIEGDVVSPFHIERELRGRMVLPGPYYLIGMAIAGLDMACWDVLGVAAGMPLVRLLGGTPGTVPAYNSNGLGIMPASEVASEAIQLVEEGFRAVKIRLGRPGAKDDLAAVRAVRRALPDDIVLMADFNQALSVHEANQRCRLLDDEGIYWIEEPIRADDFTGCARLSAEVRTPIQIGENFISVHQMESALQAHASDLVMPDIQRIGGISGWMRAAAVAQAHGVEMSSHLFPEISSSLLGVTPTAHWLEYVDWANPILAEPLQVQDGNVLIPDRPGTGLAWNEDAVRSFLLE